MGESLHRLVYYSRNQIVCEGHELVAAIDDILRVSRTNNAAVNVTGALMFNAGCFGQVLEGDQAAVRSVFERIQRDPRHRDVTLLAFEPIVSRTFALWSMGFVGSRQDDARAFAHVAQSSGFDPSKADGDTLLTALRDLAVEDEKRSGAGQLPRSET